MITLQEALTRKYALAAPAILRHFEQATGCAPTWESVTKANLHDFSEYLRDNMSTNGARQYCAKLRAVLNLYSDQIELPKDFAKILSLKSEITESLYLTTDDINTLIRYQPKNRSERLVRNQFVIGCLTAARHSDYIHFTTKNIKGDRLVYISKKTKIKAEIPLSPALRRIIADNELKGLVGESMTDPAFNKAIKRLCQAAGLTEKVTLYQGSEMVTAEKWEFVTSHTARRSCITNLYLRGVDLYLISKIAGHSSVTQTERYICCGLREIPEVVTQFFEQFK